MGEYLPAVRLICLAAFLTNKPKAAALNRAGRKDGYMNYFWPILVVIGANTLYNICAKFTPGNVNPFASLFVTYCVSAITVLILFFVTSPQKNLVVALSNANWTAIAFGLTLVGLEFGYIFIYRVGWDVSIGSLVANIGLACILLIIGILFFKETVSYTKIIGILTCVIGLILINK